MKVLVLNQVGSDALAAHLDTAALFHGIAATSLVHYACRHTDPGLVALYHYDMVRECKAVVILADQWSNLVQHLAYVAWASFRPLYVGPVEIDPSQFVSAVPAPSEVDLFA